MSRTGNGLAIGVIALTLVLPALALAADLETQARKIEGRLMAPCCMTNTVAEHHSAVALEMRAEIRQMLRQGLTEQQIVDHYVAQYGDQIRALPRARGFNLLAWLLPAFSLLLGGAGLLWIVRRWTARQPTGIAADRVATIPPEYAERLRRELRERD